MEGPSQQFIAIWLINSGYESNYKLLNSGSVVFRDVDMSKILLVDDDEFVVEYLKTISKNGATALLRRDVRLERNRVRASA